MFGKWTPSFFGNTSDDLVNEPTIDYNNTIYDFTVPAKPKSYDEPRSKYTDLFSTVRPSDGEIDRDFNDIQRRIKPTIENDVTSASLPSNYPGKFSDSTDRKIRALEREILRENTLPRSDFQSTKSDLQYTKIIKDSLATQELAQLTKKINEQNAFLEDLNGMIEVSLSQPYETKSTSIDYEQEYHKLRKELINELSTHQSFYKSYQHLMLKYRELKAKLSVDADPNKKLKDKIKLIRSTTTQASIKTMCDNILIEVTNNNIILNTYKLELEEANLKIKQLEQKLRK